MQFHRNMCDLPSTGRFLCSPRLQKRPRQYILRGTDSFEQWMDFNWRIANVRAFKRNLYREKCVEFAWYVKLYGISESTRYDINYGTWYIWWRCNLLYLCFICLCSYRWKYKFPWTFAVYRLEARHSKGQNIWKKEKNKNKRKRTREEDGDFRNFEFRHRKSKKIQVSTSV